MEHNSDARGSCELEKIHWSLTSGALPMGFAMEQAVLEVFPGKTILVRTVDIPQRRSLSLLTEA